MTKNKKTVSLVLLAAALVLIVVGVMQGDFRDTLHKAIMICLECIGIA